MRAVIESFKSNFYRKIAKQPLKKSLGFLIVFVIIVSAVISCKATLVIKNALPIAEVWVNKNLEYIISDLPTIEIKEGNLILPKEVYIKEWDKFVFLIEPTQDDVYSLLEKYPNALILTQEKSIMKTTDVNLNQSGVETYDLKNVKFFRVNPTKDGLKIFTERRELDVTPRVIKRLFARLSLFLYPLMFICLLFIYAVSKPLQVLIFSPFSLIFNANLKTALSYKNLLNIGIYALVPPTTLALVKDLLGLKIPLFWVIYSLIYIIYLFLGTKSTKETS